MMLVNAYLVMRIADHPFLTISGQYHDLFCVFAFLCGLAYYPLAYWTLMGMETGLLAVFLSASVLFAVKYAENHQPTQGILMSTSVGLAFLTRPDAAIFAVPIFAYAFFGGAKRATLVHMLALTGPFALAWRGRRRFAWAITVSWCRIPTP